MFGYQRVYQGYIHPLRIPIENHHFGWSNHQTNHPQTLGPEILRRAGFEAKDRAAGFVCHRTVNHGPYCLQLEYLVFLYIYIAYIYLSIYLSIYLIYLSIDR